MSLIIDPWDSLIVGVEWEPQIYLPDYKGFKVSVSDMVGSRGETAKLKFTNNYAVITINKEWLYEHFSAFLSVDTGAMNIEVRTEPMRLENIGKACNTATSMLAECTQMLARELKTPVVFMLPNSYKIRPEDSEGFMVSKHVNVSLSWYMGIDKRQLGWSPIDWWDIEDLGHENRIHLSFPYDMPITKENMQKRRDQYDEQANHEPLPLTASWSGRRVSILNNLF